MKPNIEIITCDRRELLLLNVIIDAIIKIKHKQLNQTKMNQTTINITFISLLVFTVGMYLTVIL